MMKRQNVIRIVYIKVLYALRVCFCWVARPVKVKSFDKVTLLLACLVYSNNILLLNAQPCIPCTRNQSSGASTWKGNYEEFTLEHQVTRQDAIDALQTLNQSYYEGPPSTSCKSISCTRNVMKYCFGPQFINDHCWCELGHANEGLPFVPHSCYVGDKQYQASIGSCFLYEEVKECCCGPALAKQWKYISSGPANTAYSCFTFSMLYSLVFYSYLLLNNKYFND